VKTQRAWRRGWRSCTGDEQYDEYEGVRRLLLVAGMTGLSLAATRAWDKYGLDLIDATLNRLPNQPEVDVQMNPLNRDLENLLLDVTRDVATRKMGLFKMTTLNAAADEKMAQALSLFKESELTEIDEDTTRFNLKLYSLYHTIAVGTTSKQSRFDLTKRVAREMLAYAERKSDTLAQKRSQSRASPRESRPVVDGINEILTGYREDGLISGFKYFSHRHTSAGMNPSASLFPDLTPPDPFPGSTSPLWRISNGVRMVKATFQFSQTIYGR